MLLYLKVAPNKPIVMILKVLKEFCVQSSKVAYILLI